MGPSPGNSSAITVTVAPADFPMPTARCPAERPIATTRYQRWVVMASVMRLLTSSTPTLRAVSKPNVGMPPGSGRSLSMVFGPWTAAQVAAVGGAQRGRGERGFVAADRDQGPDAELAQRLQAGVQPPVRVGGFFVADGRVGPRRPQDRTALDVDPRHVGDRQRPHLVGPALDEVREAVH